MEIQHISTITAETWFLNWRDEMKSFKVTLDRIEENIAVLLVRNDEAIKIDVPLILLPSGSKEGDIMDIIIIRDEKTTEAAKERVSALLEKLKSKNKT
jgi:Protein of unknown function (DUF3006)